MSNIIEILKERCLFDNLTSPELPEVLNRPATVYAGFDPTSDSLQAGNFVTIMALSHFQRCGHRVVALVGGATGLIGDPSGKSAERVLLSEEQVRHNQEGIHENLSRFLNFDHPTAPAVIVNNYDWLKSFSFIHFLRDVGKHFRMGTMLGKESVRARMDSEDGMSFTEFSYQLLQAYDFLHLHDAHDCRVQIGGSDQWGNITAGIDLVRRLRGAEVFGVTMPLVCDSNGQKFGKSEGNAIYLDADKTSFFDFYQFFIRTDDRDAIRFLKVFTFVPMDEIEVLERALAEAPERREAQKRLAEEVTRCVHGEDGLQTALRCTGALYGEAMEGLRATELLAVFADVPSRELPLEEVRGAQVINLAADAGLCSSRGDARRLAQNGGLYLNNRRVEGIDQIVTEDQVVDGQVVVLRSGKKRYQLIRIKVGTAG
jgi:tyrosyl-tRNA synthetase